MKPFKYKSYYCLALISLIIAFHHTQGNTSSRTLDESRFQSQLSSLFNLELRQVDAQALMAEVKHRLEKNPDNSRLKEAEGILYYHNKEYGQTVKSLDGLQTLDLAARQVLALSFYELKDYDDAALHFSTLPKIAMDRRTWETYCRVLNSLNKKDEAARESEFFLARYPDSRATLDFLIGHYKSSSQRDRLKARLEMAVKQNPVKPGYLLDLARLYDDMHPKALEYRKLYLKHKPDDLEGLEELGNIYEARGNKNMAAKTRLKLAPHHTQDFAFNFNLAQMLLHNGQKREARGYFEIALGLNPSHKLVPRQLSGLYKELNQVELAIDVLLRSIEQHPDDIEYYHLLLPLVEEKQGYLDVHRKVLEKLVRLDRENKHRYNRDLGLVLFAQGEFQQARKKLIKASGRFPENDRLWLILGKCEKQMYYEGEGKKHFKKAYELNPGSPENARVYGRLLHTPDELKKHLDLFSLLESHSPSPEENMKLARSLFLNRQYSAAARVWDKVLAGNADFSLSDALIAETYLKAGQHGKAIGQYEKLLKMDPYNLEILETLASLYKKTADQKQYILALQQIVNLDPGYKNYQLLLAQEMKDAGRTGKALEFFETWTEHNQTDSDALKAMHQLAEKQKDTLRLMEALEKLSNIKDADISYRFQLAELKYLRLGETGLLKKLANAHPEFKKGREILVMVHYHNGDIDKLKKFEKFMVAECKTNRELLAPLAEFYIQSGKTSQANSYSYQLLRYKNRDRGIFDKVYSFARQHDSPFTKSILKIGYESFPKDIDIKTALAGIAEEPSETFAISSEVLEQQDDNLSAIIKGAEAAVALEKFAEAKKLLKKWIQQQPDKKAWEHLAKIYAKENNQKKLAEAAGQLSDMSPDSHKWAYQAGLACKAIGNTQSALDFFRRAIALNPDHLETNIELGLALQANGYATEAKPYLQKTEKLLEFDEEICFTLSTIYLSEGDTLTAIERLKELVKRFPHKTRYAYPLATLEQNTKQTSRTIETLERLRKHKPLNAEMSFTLLRAYIKTGKKKATAALAKEILKNFPEQAGSSLDMAVLMYNRKRKGKARKILQNLTGTKHSAAAHYYLGKIAFDENKWSKAVEHFSQAGTYKPDVSLYLGQAYQKTGKKDKVAGYFEKYYEATKSPVILKKLLPLYEETGNIPGMTNTLERLIKSEPENSRYRLKLADLYYVSNKKNSIEGQYRIILHKNPMHPKANLVLGKVNAENRNFEEAVAMLRIGLNTYRKDWEAWNLLGDCYLALAKQKKALEAYKKSFRLNKKNLNAAQGKLNLIEKIGPKDELPHAYQDMVNLDPDNLEAVARLASIRFKQNKFKESADLYQQVVKQKPDDKQAWMRFGIALMETNRTAQARQALDKAMQQGETGRSVMVRMAELAIKENELQEAERLLKDVLTEYPAYHPALSLMGQIALKSSQARLAEDYFRRAIENSPSSVPYYELLAELYYREGDYNRAAGTLKKVRSSLSPKSHAKLAACYQKDGEHALALQEYQKIYQKRPSQNMLSRIVEIYLHLDQPRKASDLINRSAFKKEAAVKLILAKVKLHQKDLRGARKIIESLKKYGRTSAEHAYISALIYVQQEKHKKGIREFDRALKLEHRHPGALYHRGISLLKMEKTKKAGLSFKKLTGYRDSSWKARGYLGMAWVDQVRKDYTSMAENLKLSLKHNFSVEAVHTLTRTLIQLKHVDTAEKVVEAAYKLNSRHPKMIAAKAEVLLAKDMTNQAYRFLKNSLYKNPHSCDLLIEFAKVNLSMGNYDNVSEGSRHALRKCPDLPDAYLLLGYAAFKEYRKKEARKQFKHYLKLGGDVQQLPEKY
ncbi:tetratricopeptide repeat protein [Fibrobacterota bacterium]